MLPLDRHNRLMRGRCEHCGAVAPLHQACPRCGEAMPRFETAFLQDGQPRAYMNWGVWKWKCPDCGSTNLAENDICQACFPEMKAMANQMKPGHENKLRPLFVPVVDLEARQAERQRAQAAGKVWQVVFPQQRAAIEQALRPRLEQNMNWYPGDSLALLKADNKAHGVQA